MYQKLFKVTLVLFLVVVSIVMVGFIMTAILSVVSSPMIARDGGIAIVAGGLSERRLAFMIVAASLVIAGLYLYRRRRRFHR